MSFVADVVDAADAGRTALVALSREGARREISFGEVSDRSARLAGTLTGHRVGRGDVVLTVVGNRPEWVYALLACWRTGFGSPAVPEVKTTSAGSSGPTAAGGTGEAS